jgi:hypothetical protein
MRRVVLIGLLSALGACSLDSTGPSHSYFGTWHLRTLNGQALPYDDGTGLVIVSQEITIEKNGSFSSDASSTFQGQQVGRSYSGSCALKTATQLICTVTDGSEFGFVWQGDSLFTAVPSGGASVYKR